MQFTHFTDPKSSYCPHEPLSKPNQPPHTSEQSSISPNSKQISKENLQKTVNLLHKERRSKWAPIEDHQLLTLITRLGTQWTKIGKIIGGKTGKQVRDRYLETLNPDISKQKWSKQEDSLLLSLYEKFGNKWMHMATAMPGRCANQLKYRFKVLRPNVKAKSISTVEIYSPENEVQSLGVKAEAKAEFEDFKGVDFVIECSIKEELDGFTEKLAVKSESMPTNGKGVKMESEKIEQSYIVKSEGMLNEKGLVKSESTMKMESEKLEQDYCSEPIVIKSEGILNRKSKSAKLEQDWCNIDSGVKFENIGDGSDCSDMKMTKNEEFVKEEAVKEEIIKKEALKQEFMKEEFSGEAQAGPQEYGREATQMINKTYHPFYYDPRFVAQGIAPRFLGPFFTPKLI